VKATTRLLAVAILPLALAGNAPAKECMAGLRKTLVAQGFEPVFCSKKDASFVLVGRTAGSGFSIYDYRYAFRAAAVMHGGQRLVVMRGSKYVGQYSLLPLVTVSVRGKYVVLKGDDDREPVKLDFSRRPPAKILVNGEQETFYR
jgi:hypothetical protein